MNHQISGFIQLYNGNINYEISGQGPSLLLHENNEDMRYFDPQVSSFCNHYRVITLDTRAHGKSTTNHVMFDFKLLAYDVITVLDTLNISKVPLLAKLIASSIKGSKLEVIPEGTHFVSRENPKVFHHVIFNFLSTVKPISSG